MKAGLLPNELTLQTECMLIGRVLSAESVLLDLS